MFKQFFGYFKNYKKYLYLSAVFVILETLFELIIPLIMADIIDIGVANGDIQYVLNIGFKMIIVAFIGILGGILCGIFTSIAAMTMGKNLRKGNIIMSVIHAIILGIIQGITEFLPVSSFGHLCGVQDLLGGTRGSGVLFEVMLHLGTMIALILVFLKDIKKIGIELIGMILDLIGNANIFLYNRRTGKELTYAKIISGTYRKLTALIMVSTIPTVLIGYQCKRLVVRSASSHMFSGIGILLTGVILLVVDYSNVNGSKGTKETSFGDAMWMGICQGLSVFPGLSRLGLTMSAGLFCGLGRKFAVKYSLLMSIPAVVGAFLGEMGEFTSVHMTVGQGFIYVLGMIVAGITGYLVIRFMLKLSNQVRLRYFVFYSFAAGILILAANYI